MVTTNNDITQKTYKRLSIQATLSGLSFCMFDTLQNAIETLEEVDYPDQFTDFSQTFIDKQPLLNQTFDSVTLIHQNSWNTFVPKPFFEEENKGQYLQFALKTFPSDTFLFDEVEGYDMVNVYLPYQTLTQTLQNIHVHKQINAQSILVSKALEFSKNKETEQIFIHFQKKSFQLVAIKNSKLLLYNSFDIQTPQDFVYYLLFSLEQLQFNPEHVPVWVMGDWQEHTESFELGYAFVRNFNPYPVQPLVDKWGLDEKTILKHYILLHS